MATNDKSSEEQLKEQLEQICIDYKQLTDKSKNMPPKDSKNVDPNAEAVDEDIEGMLDTQFIEFAVFLYSLNKARAITSVVVILLIYHCLYLSKISLNACLSL